MRPPHCARGGAATTVAAVTAIATVAVTAAGTVVALLHHGGGAVFVLLDADGHVAQDVFVEAHLTLHLFHGGSRGVDVDERVIRLAILLDAVRQGLQTPVLNLADLAAIGFQHATILLDEGVDLLAADILAGKEYVLVERHIDCLSVFLFRTLPGISG